MRRLIRKGLAVVAVAAAGTAMVGAVVGNIPAEVAGFLLFGLALLGFMATSGDDL